MAKDFTQEFSSLINPNVPRSPIRSAIIETEEATLPTGLPETLPPPPSDGFIAKHCT